MKRDPTPRDAQWLRLGYTVIVVLTLFRWGYQIARVTDLSEDEAYQWVWSKHLDWSYYSKPPGIALAQWLGTHLGGDTEFGVRFFTPLISGLLAWMSFRFLTRMVPARWRANSTRAAASNEPAQPWSIISRAGMDPRGNPSATA